MIHIVKILALNLLAWNVKDASSNVFVRPPASSTITHTDMITSDNENVSSVLSKKPPKSALKIQNIAEEECASRLNMMWDSPSDECMCISNRYQYSEDIIQSWSNPNNEDTVSDVTGWCCLEEDSQVLNSEGDPACVKKLLLECETSLNMLVTETESCECANSYQKYEEVTDEEGETSGWCCHAIYCHKYDSEGNQSCQRRLVLEIYVLTVFFLGPVLCSLLSTLFVVGVTILAGALMVALIAGRTMLNLPTL